VRAQGTALGCAPIARSYRSTGYALPQLRAVAQRLEYREIVDRVASEVDGPMLDWGCGLGQISDMLRSRGVDVTSFDYRPGLSGDGRERLTHFPHVEAYVSGDPVRLPFADAQFAAVLSLGVLEHVARPDESLEELRRVLRRGGMLYVYKLPNRFSWLEWLARKLGLYYHGAAEHDRVYDGRSARAIIERHGFSVLEFRRANMLPLTVTRLGPRPGRMVWALNRPLARVPGLNLLATNLELVARRP
jgi:SAM-dependent methyltransferase